MKKSTLFTAAMLFIGITANAQTGYCTAAMNADGESTFKWDEAQNFCPIIVSDAVAEAMTGKGIKKDLRVDDTNRFLYVWDNTYTAAESDGLNTFGDFGGYLDMVVGTVGWSGLGFIETTNPVDFSFLDDGNYYLHFGTKGTTASQCIGFCDGKFSIGEAAFVDNGNSIKNIGNWVADGEWYYFDVPVEDIYTVMGGKLNVFTAANGGQAAYKSNYLWALSGGTAGTHLVLENVFLYQKKGETDGINSVNAADGKQTLYDVQGRKVADMSKSGIYIVKTAQGNKKVAVK